ncbi:signal transduction histidine kinase [Loktanella ponticola]|uniref:histidine kinase n=1 Tax=Yoonia ponticola TaxID=1524255 RepID=A0A7W9EWN4_9RHOB|nr:HAMP domain-containing sensor histidine kinase [Yoonia ponticola]MBB5720789.1 signal transduction histidine kinase [Yoonia ponticola]
MFNSLSGRFLVLTIVFVMLAEVFIFVPSIARFREDYLLERLERAQLASLALETDAFIEPELVTELLKNAEVYNVVLRRNEVRQLVLSSPIPFPVMATYDMRDTSSWELIRDAMATLVAKDQQVIRVIGTPVQGGGLLIEITTPQMPLRAAMLEYGRNVLWLSLVISVITAALLFFAVRFLLVRPIKRLVDQMDRYAAAPEDARKIIEPTSKVRELYVAELALQKMESQLTGALRQKDRLAQLGGAVAKVSHDLRNILTSAQLFTDRIEGSEDPLVKRMAPKLVGSISRAVNLCETTLAFGRVEEPQPTLARLPLSGLVDELLEGERLASGEAEVSFVDEVPADMIVRADGEQIFRVLSNLLRNARQAIMATRQPGTVTIRGYEDDTAWWIEVADTGPGLPKRARENLFKPFEGGARKGGSGLGLVIAGDLIRGHGGRLELGKTDETGTTFVIHLPKADLALQPIEAAKA